MKCKQVQLWLLQAKAADPRPAFIEKHLAGCPSCQERQRSLERLDEHVQRMAIPPSNPSVKDQLWKRLDQLPREPRRPAPRTKLPSWRILVGTFAAALLIGFGWGIGYQTAARPSADSAVPSASNGGQHPLALARISPISPRLAEQNVRLAVATRPAEQLDALLRMETDLRSEALRLAHLGARDGLIVAAQLYGHVVRRGVLGRVKSLTPDERKSWVPSIRQQFDESGGEVEAGSADLLPAAVDLLRPLGEAARDCSACLASEAKIAAVQAAPLPSQEAQPLLTVLVLAGLQLAEEPDALRRAELSADLSRHLAQVVVLLSAAGETTQADEMGTAFAQLMEGGVADNLEGEEAGPKGTRRAEAERIRQRASQAANILERNLSQAPPAVKKGLERAVRMSQGRGRAMKDGKGKGKLDHGDSLWLRPEWKDKKGPKGLPFVPPGQQRKKEKPDPSKRPGEDD